MKNFLVIILALFAAHTQAQVKIGNNPNTINPNSLLEMESTDKGFLPPRVALNSTGSVSPLTGTVPAGMLVFSTAGTLANGYYYWNGTQWVILASSNTSFVIKTANATLTKTETFVLASNDIMLTLPVVTSADDGLSITIKNIGTHTDLVAVVGNSGAVIDNGAVIALPRWFSLTMTANGGNWYFKERTIVAANTLEVSPYGSWQTLQEALEFLNLHAWGPTVIKLASGEFEISETQDIDLPFPLTIMGSSYGTTTLVPSAGLAGKPMFRCVSDCYFKMLQFDATALTGYGTAAGEDAIRFVGSGTYNEIKDCNFDRFYNTILDSSDAELWIFETDINNAQNNGILIHSGEDSVTVKVAETDFINCKRGINLSKGIKATIQLSSGGYYNSGTTDTAIIYRPSTFTTFRSISITGNTWNNTGKLIEGFDFTRTDGRDANAILLNNAGVGDSKPQCFINVLNSITGTYLATLNTWYKIDWGTNTSTQTTKWTINNNKITYQSANRRNGSIIISGNVSADANSQNLTVGIVKNGVTTTQYGATTIRTTTADQPFTFSVIVYLSDIGPNDYFELFVKNETSSLKTVKFQDIQWLVITQ
ncbi:MAG TPA: hypothetical protein VK489_07870 [Ferruginibacter sp.]|nr:hypothetical protein [Ferruginibacter sp.]